MQTLFMPPVPRGGRALLALATAALAWLAGPAAHASTYQWFTSGTAFAAALQPGSFTASGTALSSPAGDLGTATKSLSAGGASPYGFTVSVASGNLYGVVNFPGISSVESGATLTFSAFTPSNQVRAFGGLFSVTNSEDNRVSGQITLSLYTGAAGTTLISGTTAFTAATGPAFLGLMTDDATPITRVEFSNSSGSLYANAESITIGMPVAVPEPSTLAAAGAGAVSLGIAYRRRRRAARGRAVAESET